LDSSSRASSTTIREEFLDQIRQRILVIDGATGTAIQDRDLTDGDFGGEELHGCNENLVLVRPDVIGEIHREYLEAGADLIETNSFGATPLVLAEYGLEDLAEEINRESARLAKVETERQAKIDGRRRWVLGSMGPTTKTLTVTGGATFGELRESYRVQARGLLLGGSDILLLETVQDTLNLKAASLGIDDASQDVGFARPMAISCTIEPMGTMLAGQEIDAFYASIEHLQPVFIGMNCATGPRFMTDHLRTLAGISAFPVSVYPNAGLPDSDGFYEETADILAGHLAPFVENGWVNLVGGCCGTTPLHIAAISRLVEGRPPREPVERKRTVLAGIEAIEVEEDNLPLIVGERTNVIGSRRFKKMIFRRDFEKAAEIGRKQSRGGAHILDVCMADPDSDELADMKTFLNFLNRLVKQPIMIDSTDEIVIEAALQLCQGKSVINSINLEDGEDRFQKVVPLARRYGAALVVGCIDEDPEDGMGHTVERKLEIAERSHRLLTGKYGFQETNIIFDPLVFPVGTGDEKYSASAEATIDGVRAISERFPRCSTILGISNVSFGLPPAGREALNSVFLYHCVKAGLTMAIVNSEKMDRYASIPDEGKRLCEDLIWQRSEDPIAAFAEHFRGRKVSVAEKSALLQLPLEQRLARNIIEGTKEGLEDALPMALEKFQTPLEVINGPLMTGMAEVGRLFNGNELIVAEVLQSAEVMKAAVAWLEPYMEKEEGSSRGKVLLATVKGDVHDIGKNLVQIILSNNGYEVIDLGIKVSPAALIEAVMEHHPDAIGLSGLLVKSAKQMVVTAEDLKASNIELPILVGGAALSEKFTALKIAPATDSTVIYSKDAMSGLAICNQLFDESSRDEFITEIRRNQDRLVRGGSSTVSAAVATDVIPSRSEAIAQLEVFPHPPDYDLHVEVGLLPQDLFSYVNPQMLYCRHLGLKGNFNRKRDAGDAKALKLEKLILELLDECTENHWLTPRAMWRFFPVTSSPTVINFHSPTTGETLESSPFPRQGRPPFLSLCDLVGAAEDDGTPTDHIAMLVTTCGAGIREKAKQWMVDGEYLRSHSLQALAIELAEATAEWSHQKIRSSWGFPDPDGIPKLDLFRARYRGKRYSFGYPACPDLSQQEKLWRLLEPQNHIGVELTEGYMMDPEASVSALVFHHPDATYFGVGGRGA